MPTPNKDESRKEFLDRCIPIVVKEQKSSGKKSDTSSAAGKCGGMFDSSEKKGSDHNSDHGSKDKSKRKETTSFFPRVKTKEEGSLDEGVYTFIAATTLPDRTAETLEDGTHIDGEILSKNVLDNIAEMINDTDVHGGKHGSYRTVSLFHNRVHEEDPSLEEAGFVKPQAEVIELEKFPGNFGLKVPVEVNKMFKPPENYSDYTPEKIKYKIEKDAIGLSVEYNNSPEQESIVEVAEGRYRLISGTDDFRGFGFARVNLIGNTSAVRVKEVYPSIKIKTKEGEDKMADEKKDKEAKEKEVEEQLAASQAKVKELEAEKAAAEKAEEKEKVKEVEAKLKETEQKVKELKLSQDANATKLKESIELAIDSLKFDKPAKTKEDSSKAKIKEVYDQIEAKDFVKFKEAISERFEENEGKIKEMMAVDGPGFNFEKHQTLKVKCVGGGSGKMMVVATVKTKELIAKTKNVIDATDMAESTYNQTNAMFADRYVAGITETFLMDDSLLTAMPKENHIGGNDKYQWRLWVDFVTTTGNNTLAVDPNVTSVTRTQRDFEKMESPIREYRDGVEVTDFTQHHSLAAVGSLMDIEITRAAEAVTQSMAADLFKGKVEATAGWLGFNGLIGFADSSTHSTLYGKTRSAANRLLDATLANTYVSTSEGITITLVRSGYEKVLAQGSSLGDIVIVMHPVQMRRLWDTEDADIRHIITVSTAPPAFGFTRSVVPHIDGIPVIRDYNCQSSAAANDMFAIVDFSKNKGLNLIVSKPLGMRGLAKVGTSESAYVSFWGQTVYKAPRNVFVHDSLTAT